jgi:hypothetical protein
MAQTYETAEAVESIAASLIPTEHPELATARFIYVFAEKSSNKGGREVWGKVRKLSGVLQWLLEKDFLIEVALDKWNEFTELQRRAGVDHLLERCTGEEDEKTGEMVWKCRDPEVQEFSSILNRYGVWHEGLSSFIEVAKAIDLDGLAKEAANVDLTVIN